MYIMAYLGPVDRRFLFIQFHSEISFSQGYNEEEDEFVVCRITLFESSKLLVEPRIGDRGEKSIYWTRN